MFSILLVDDEIKWMKGLQRTLCKYEIAEYSDIHLAEDGKSALSILAEKKIDIVFLDLRMGSESGEDLLKSIKSQYPDLTVVIMTGLTTVQPAINCMEIGADDYFTKTMEIEELVTSIKRVISVKNLDVKERFPKNSEAIDVFDKIFSSFVTSSPKMQTIFKYIRTLEKSNQPILITGESGVGKGLLASLIAQFTRPEKPFISINVAGLDDQMFSDTLFGHNKGAYTSAETSRQGMIQQAGDGTILLDEIGGLSQHSQLKLLYLTQSNEYQPLGSDRIHVSNARLIFATNEDLKEKQNNGSFRKDLYYRLSTHHIHIPAIRERREDIPLLIKHFIKQIADLYNIAAPNIPESLLALLCKFDFHGNTRQLYSKIYDAVLKAEGNILTMSDFKEVLTECNKNEKTEDVIPKSEIILPLDDIFDDMVQKAVNSTGGNSAKAAALLGISQSTLNRRLKKIRE